jgi:phage baseplate assembly protein W
MSTDFYGTGLAQPLALSTTNGARAATGVDKVDQSIRVILGTQHGERVMRPDFGCNLKSLVFAPMNEGTVNLARYYVLEGLTKWETRIDVTDVGITVDSNQGALIINVTYRLRSTQELRTLVYPFFLGTGSR